MLRRWFFVFVALFMPRAVWPQGNPAGPEFRVNTFTTNVQDTPAAAADPSGNFVVVWQGLGQDGSLLGIFGQRYASTGVPLGPEFRVNTNTIGTQALPDVASDAFGNFVVVWQSNQDAPANFGIFGQLSASIFGQRYASTGAPLGPEFRVNTYTTNDQFVPSVAADPSGNFVVVWSSYGQDGSNGSFGIYGQRFASTGAPLGPEFRVNTYTTNDQFVPSVAADPSGNFVVVWSSYGQDGSNFGIFGQRFASTGAPLSPEFRVNTYTTNGQFIDPSGNAVAQDAPGNFVVVWTGTLQDGSATGIHGQRFASSGVPLGPEFRVNSYTFGTQEAPAVAGDSAGNFVVVWYGEDGSAFGIFGQRYASTGAPLGAEFPVNTYTTGLQKSPSVAADIAGNFVVAWDSDLQDYSGPGVFGQRYRLIIPVELIHFRVE